MRCSAGTMLAVMRASPSSAWLGSKAKGRESWVMSLSFQAHEHERTRLGVSPELGLGMCGETPRRTAYTPSKPPPLGGRRWVVC